MNPNTYASRLVLTARMLASHAPKIAQLFLLHSDIKDKASFSNNTDIPTIEVSSQFNVKTDSNVTNIPMVDDVILQFIAKLYSNSSITRNIVQILVDCSELVQNLLSYIKYKFQSEISFSSDNNMVLLKYLITFLII